MPISRTILANEPERAATRSFASPHPNPSPGGRGGPLKGTTTMKILPQSLHVGQVGNLPQTPMPQIGRWQPACAAGFTLVELLVVIAIISMIVGMMFPAVSAMPEAARRATCQSRLARLGMALQKYESGYGAVPVRHDRPPGADPQCPAGHARELDGVLLPDLDEGGTLKQIDLAAGVYAEKNAAVRRLRIAAFTCPSQRIRLGKRTRPRATMPAASTTWSTPIAADNHGVLFLNSHISPARRDRRR